MHLVDALLVCLRLECAIAAGKALCRWESHHGLISGDDLPRMIDWFQNDPLPCNIRKAASHIHVKPPPGLPVFSCIFLHRKVRPREFLWRITLPEVQLLLDKLTYFPARPQRT